jgi:Lon protease-like protein
MSTSPANTIHAVPMFPLPDFFLFPGAVAPLHIFEPRYRRMINDLLDSAGRLVLVAYRPDGPRTEAGPEVMDVGGLGEIVHHETLADGRFLIWVLGLGRVEVSEVPSDRPYRLADARLVADEQPDAAGTADATVAELTPRLMRAIEERAPRGQKLEGELPVGLLADILLNALPLDAESTASIFAERCPLTRARTALDWHQQY